ncbi:MAG TPA: hypothetical protein VGJ81_22660 [Thermoanaerobaculia bacterium]
MAGVACVVPEAMVRNHEIVELIDYHSRGIYDGNLRSMLTEVGAKIARTGIVSRHWRTSKERPFALLRRACDEALAKSGVTASEVDFVIYAGVDRGFAEPANACFVAKELGMRDARTFDVADACLGWSTATEIAQGMFASAPGAIALVVSAEFPMRPNGAVLPECFTIATHEELDWKFPAFTLGEAATASVLVGDGPAWQYSHEAHNEFADLCSVALAPANDYAGASARLSDEPRGSFRAYGSELALQTYKPAVRVLRDALMGDDSPRIVFPHSVIGPYIESVVRRVSPHLTVFSTFSDMGNVATSSLPSCVARARDQRIIQPDDVPLAWVAASGLKVSAFRIVQASL